MPFSFSISGASQEQYVFTGWGDLGQLIESQALSVGSGDSLSGFSGESKGANSESFWDVQESGVISYRSNDCEDSCIELGLTFSDWGVIGGESSHNS